MGGAFSERVTGTSRAAEIFWKYANYRLVSFLWHCARFCDRYCHPRESLPPFVLSQRFLSSFCFFAPVSSDIPVRRSFASLDCLFASACRDLTPFARDCFPLLAVAKRTSGSFLLPLSVFIILSMFTVLLLKCSVQNVYFSDYWGICHLRHIVLGAASVFGAVLSRRLVSRLPVPQRADISRTKHHKLY